QRLLPRERREEPAAEHRAGLQPDRVLHRLRVDPPPAGDREGGLLHGARPRRLQGDEEAAGVLRLTGPAGAPAAIRPTPPILAEARHRGPPGLGVVASRSRPAMSSVLS